MYDPLSTSVIRLRREDSATSISGVSLKVYTFLLESKRPQGVREIARSLGIPVSTVHYHLKRLEDLGLIVQDPEGYRVSRIMDIEGFVVIRNKLIPRLLVYSMFFLGVILGEIFVIGYTGTLNVDRIVLIIVSLVGFLILLIEGVNARARLRPRKIRNTKYKV